MCDAEAYSFKLGYKYDFNIKIKKFDHNFR